MAISVVQRGTAIDSTGTSASQMFIRNYLLCLWQIGVGGFTVGWVKCPTSDGYAWAIPADTSDRRTESVKINFFIVSPLYPNYSTGASDG